MFALAMILGLLAVPCLGSVNPAKPPMGTSRFQPNIGHDN